MRETADRHPEVARVELWFMDEARIGQKGRVCHRWYERGVRPPGLADQRYDSLYLFAACRPGTDQAFALALPEATAASMEVFLAQFAQALEPGVHAVLLLDRAGWHTAHRLAVPANVTLMPLPAYSPELNPVERVWLYLRERFLSHCVEADYAALLDAAHQQLGGPIVLVWDNLRMHLAEPLREFIARHADWLTVFQLPSYSPDLNPQEGIWSLIKRDIGNLAAADLGQITRAVKHRLKRIQYRPDLVDGCLTGTGLITGD